MEPFRIWQLSPRVVRIGGLMHEFVYLIKGDERAALIDSGCGFGSLRQAVRSLTGLPLVVLEHATLAQYFLKEDDHWAFATYTAGEQLRAAGAYIYEPQETPPPQITYYLANGTKKLPAIQRFLSLLDEKLGTLPKEKVQSFL